MFSLTGGVRLHVRVCVCLCHVARHVSAGCRPIDVPKYLALPQIIQTCGGFPVAVIEALLLRNGCDKLKIRCG